MNIRNFNDDLAKSESPEVVESIVAACYRRFPDLLSVTKAHRQNDMRGVDYWLEFSGKQETLDVKVRELDYSVHPRNPDDRIICLELVSNTRTGKPGWSVDFGKLTDWVMFYYAETGKDYIYPARLLRAAVIAEMDYLLSVGKKSTQATGNYQSNSIFVEPRDLWKVIYNHAQPLEHRMKLAA